MVDVVYEFMCRVVEGPGGWVKENLPKATTIHTGVVKAGYLANSCESDTLPSFAH